MMVTVIDLASELAKLKMLPGTDAANDPGGAKGSSAQMAPHRDGAIFTTKFAGKGGWERHRNGDELVHILDGAATLYLMTDDRPQALTLEPGMIAVVPQGTWHRFESPDGVTLMTATPQPTDHPPVHVEAPRILE